jgi:PAS domain S-box-containing protein
MAKKPTYEELKQRIKELDEEVAERKRLEAALRESEEKWGSLVDNAPNVIMIVDREGIIQYINQTVSGIEKGEAIGSSHYSFAAPDYHKVMKESVEQVFETGRVTRYEIAGVGPDGGMSWYATQLGPIKRKGKVVAVTVMPTDITKRKRVEQSLRNSEEELRRISSRLMTAQEDERKRICRDLHDSIGQSLAAVKFGVENVLAKTEQQGNRASVELLEKLILLIQHASEEARRIQTNLRPSLLDDLGITATISWFCRDFERLYSGIHVEKQINIEEGEIPEPFKVDMFRILQEALNNVAKHSKADLVRLALRRTHGQIDLVIEDNGQGFDPEYVWSVKKADAGVGLTSMKERAELSGGALSVKSHKGRGTTVQASWPC